MRVTVQIINITLSLLFAAQVYAFENLALWKPVWEQYPWPKKNIDYGSENAVDGLYSDRSASGGQCTISDGGKSMATLGVDLGEVASISYIDIYYRTDNLQECGIGVYGYNCSNQCSSNCFIESQCDRITGYCQGGCKSGWTGEMCYQGCPDGYFGTNCSKQCSVNCDETNPCDRFTGRCDGECKPGWKGLYCNETCSFGLFGSNCDNKCSSNCRGVKSCNHMTVICDEGCIEGWRGAQCDSECSVGYFGLECRNKCSENCIETHKCDRLSGECDNGCNPGWKGGTCNDHCDETFFGINCSQTCGSNCVNFSCHHQTGNCKVYFQHLEKTDPSSLPTIIGGSSGAIILLLLIVGIVIFSKR